MGFLGFITLLLRVGMHILAVPQGFGLIVKNAFGWSSSHQLSAEMMGLPVTSCKNQCLLIAGTKHLQESFLQVQIYVMHPTISTLYSNACPPIMNNPRSTLSIIQRASGNRIITLYELWFLMNHPTILHIYIIFITLFITLQLIQLEYLTQCFFRRPVFELSTVTGACATGWVLSFSGRRPCGAWWVGAAWGTHLPERWQSPGHFFSQSPIVFEEA